MNWPIRIASVVAAIGGCFLIDAFARGQNSYAQLLITLAALYITLAVSLNLINGITGQFSIGHAAFYQVGAYSAGYFSVHFFGKQPLTGVVWLVAMMLVGGVFAGIAGLAVGLPSLRLRGDYLAIVTLGFGEIIRILTQNIEPLGGAYGLTVKPKIPAIWLAWLLAVLCIAICRNLLRTAHGLAFLAVREDEVASAAMGVHVTRTKVIAFVIGSVFAGAAGALLAHYTGFISPDQFKMDVSFIILTMVVLGGTGSITGSALAAMALFYLPEYLRGRPPVSGASFLAAVIAILIAVKAIRVIAEKYHGSKQIKSGMIVGSLIGAVVLQIVFALALSAFPALKQASFEGDKLRMVIFAGTLIILMLVRPQGIFAHHELSWSWLGRLFGRPTPDGAKA